MPSTLNALATYHFERLIKGPWLAMPFILFVIGHSEGVYQFNLLYPLVAAILFFRVFDDLFCFNYDRAHKSHKHLDESQRPLIILTALYGFLYFLCLWQVFNAAVLILNGLFIVLSIALYVRFLNERKILLIATLKYPLLLYMVASHTGQIIHIWIVAASLFFLMREVIEEFYHRRSVLFEFAFLSGLMTAKLLMRVI